MMKAQAAILESDRPEEAQRKLRQAVPAIIPDADEAGWVERHLRPLAGVESEDIGGGDRTNESFAAWRQFFEALAEEQALALVFEDLHWADRALLQFIDYLVDWASGVPILVIATTRPELLARQPDWGGGKSNCATIQLSPLSDAETSALVEGLLEDAGLSAEAERELLERAGGNPLYAEEFARMRTDRPEVVALPESVHALIAARLDGLPSEEKELLQNAAVIGRAFWLGALGRERWRLEERLHALARKEFVRRERKSSVAGELEFTFRHGLIREVAYEQRPKSQRAAKHESTARWIESLGRPDDHAEMLAHHYVEALRYADWVGGATDELAARAVEKLRAAGDRALALNAYQAAARFYDQALRMPAANTSDTMSGELLLSLGDACARGGDLGRAKETFLAAAELARRTRSLEQLARAALGYGGRFVWTRAWGDERLVPLLQEALAALPEQDSELRVRLLARLAGGPLRDILPPEQRVEMSQQAVDMARRLGDDRTLAYALDGRHCSDWGPNTVAERLALADEMIRVAERCGDRERAYAGHDYRFSALLEGGDVRSAYVESETRARFAEELRQPAQLWDVAVIRATLALLEGRFAEAEELTAEALGVGREAQTANAQMAYSLQIYAIRREQGRLDEIVDVVEKAVEEYVAYPVWRYVLADVLSQLERREEAREVLQRLAAEGFSVPLEMQWLFSLSLLPEVCRYLGDAQRAATLHELLGPYADRNAFTPPELCRGSVARALGILAATSSRWEEAAKHFEFALQMNEHLGARAWLAHTGYDYAAMLAARGGTQDNRRAAQLFTTAQRSSRQLGMKALSDQIDALEQEIATAGAQRVEVGRQGLESCPPD